MQGVGLILYMLAAVSSPAGLLFSTLSSGPAASFVEVGGKVVMEAENFTRRTGGMGTDGVEKNWVGATGYAGYSGVQYMQAAPNNNTGCTGEKPCLNYDVTFTNPGEYVVMVRLYGPSASDNSVLIGVDGSVLTTGSLGVEGGAAWSWRYKAGVSSAFTVSAPGTKTINIWMREDGVCVDKVILIKNLPDELLAPYDPDIAMWRSSIDSHLTRSTGQFLLAAGLMGELDKVRVEDALSTLKSCQLGRFKWTYEESLSSDYNADFFVLLDLIPFYLHFSNQLSDVENELIEGMFETANGYMTTRIAAFDETRYRYPNSTIGDLVVTYLLNEMSGLVSTNTTAQLRAAFDYYDRNEWGWGEHLSDTYVKVIQDELSLLILCSSSLPVDIEAAARQLLRELIAVDKQFPEGVRVPAIRSYALTGSPKTPLASAYSSQMFSETVTNAPAGADYLQQYALRELWYQYGWHSEMDEGSVAAAGHEISCYDGVSALNSTYGRCRVGVLTEYPLMENIDYPGWGLLWQSMPAAFRHEEGDWGFLQWEVLEGSNELALPSNNRYTQPSKVLTTGTVDSPLPVTRGVAINGGYLAVRTMPSTLSSWSTVEDRVRILDGTATVSEPVGSNDWECLTLDWGEEELFVDYLPLQSGSNPAQESTGNRYDWGFKYNLPISGMASIWMLRVDNSAGLPKQYAKQDAWTLVWEDGTHLSVQPYVIGASQSASRIFQMESGQVCMEAENGRFAGRMDHKSWWLFREMTNGGYSITIDSSSAPNAVAGDADLGTASYYFDLSSGQSCSFLARLNAPTSNDDSFFYRIDSGEWVTCNNYGTGSDWKWKKYGDDFYLGAGQHRLTIYYREDGTNLDRFLIQGSSMTDLTGSTDVGPTESLWLNP
jgi:hypothetical protein